MEVSAVSNIQDLVDGLMNCDDKQAYHCLKQLEDKSSRSAEVYPFFDTFVEMLNNKNSYIRTRGIILIAANAKWDVDIENALHRANSLRYKDSMQLLVFKDIQKSLDDIRNL